MERQAGIDLAYPRSGVVIERYEPQEYIDDIFEPPQQGLLSRAWETLYVRYLLWRIGRNVKKAVRP